MKGAWSMGSNRLKAILRKQGKTQFWLSRETGITCPDLSQVMNGKKYCFPGWRKKISQALNLPEEEIFTDTPNKVGA